MIDSGLVSDDAVDENVEVLVHHVHVGPLSVPLHTGVPSGRIHKATIWLA